VTIGAKLVHHLTGKEEWSRGSKEHVFVLDFDSARPDHVVESSRVAANVVAGVRPDQVVVVGSAIENYVSVCRHLSGGGIVSDLVGVQRVGAEAHHDVAAGLVNVLVLFLFVAANQHFVPAQGNVHGRTRRPQLMVVAARLNFLLNDLFSLFVFLASIGFPLASGFGWGSCCAGSISAVESPGNCGLAGISGAGAASDEPD